MKLNRIKDLEYAEHDAARSRIKEKSFFALNEERKYLDFKLNQAGFSLMVVFAAVLVLFTTVSFIQIGSMQKIEPDLRRIGINFGPQASTSQLAENQTTNPNQSDTGTETTETNLIIASSSLNIDADADIESEGDNPPYIE